MTTALNYLQILIRDRDECPQGSFSHRERDTEMRAVADAFCSIGVIDHAAFMAAVSETA